MKMKNFRNGFLALLGVGACFLTYKPEAPPNASASSSGPPVADTTITLSCKEEPRMFDIFPGPLPYPEVEPDTVEINNFPCVPLNLKGGLPFNGLCAEGHLEDALGNSCNVLVNPKPTCVMQFKHKDSTINITGTTKHGTVVNRLWVNYAWVTKSMMANPQNLPNAPKWLVAELYDANWNLKAIDSVNVNRMITKDSSGLVEFIFDKYFDANKGFHILVYGTDPLYGYCDPANPNCNPAIWEFYGFKIEFLCSALGNFCQWGPAKKVWEETNGCEKIVYYEWVSSCGEKYVAKYVFTDYDAPVVLNKPQDVTIYMPQGECEMEYLIPSITFEDCDKNASVLITTPYGNIRGNGGYIDGIRVQIKKFEVIYTITDACGNQTICSYWVNVKEGNWLTPACDENTVVSLNIDSCILVPAKTFLDAVSGICCSYTVYGMRLDNQKGGQDIKFCCDDVGKTITVMLTIISDCDPNVRNSCNVKVEVQNKQPPRITCPKDITVSCDTFDLSNLSKYGKPIATANCGVSVKDTFVDLRTMCRTGDVVRTFVVTSSNGMTASCSQTITIVDTKQFNQSNITWPRDTVFWECSASYGKERAGEPKFTYSGCSRSIGFSMKDQVFTFHENGKCKYIERTWKVIDWCNFDPQRGPYWTHVQRIHVMDSVKPTITFCPSDTSVSNNGSCLTDSVEVKLDTITATDCAGIQKVVNDSKYAYKKGGDASGKYPNGVHKVTFTVYDACGTSSTCSMTITVSDKKAPSPFCMNGVIIELQNMPGMGITQQAPISLLILRGEDNCTPPQRLVWSYARDTLITNLWFTCNDLDTNEVELWVTDEAGNKDFCRTVIIVQDNNNLCPPTFKDTLMVAGALQRPNGREVEHVEINLDTLKMVCSGFYKFDSLAPKTHLVKPFKDDDPMEGVSTRDIVLIQRHILGLYPFTPYQMIAADVTKSGSITSADITEIRKLILGSISTFSKNTSFRFVPKAYNFPAGAMNWNFPETLIIGYGKPPGDVMDADFFGIKIGDVDGSANTFQNNDEYEYLSISGKWLPESEQVILQIPEEFGDAIITVVDLQGRIVRVNPQKSGENLMISLEKYPNGIYLVSVSTEKWDEPYFIKVLKL